MIMDKETRTELVDLVLEAIAPAIATTEEAHRAGYAQALDRMRDAPITDEVIGVFWAANTKVWRNRAPISQGDSVLVNRDATRAGLVAALTRLSAQARADAPEVAG